VTERGDRRPDEDEQHSGAAPVLDGRAWSARSTPMRRATGTTAPGMRGRAAQVHQQRRRLAGMAGPLDEQQHLGRLAGRSCEITARTASSGRSGADLGTGTASLSASASASRVPTCSRRAVQASPAVMTSRQAPGSGNHILTVSRVRPRRLGQDPGPPSGTCAESAPRRQGAYGPIQAAERGA
jgi:hypothetical protein